MMMRAATTILLLTFVAGCGSGEPRTADSDGEVLSADQDGEALSADGLTIRYEVHGTGDPAIVLVHGWTNSRAIWGEHPSTLSRTHRVVALDLAGHGESDADRSEWTVDAFGEDVVAVVEDVGLDSVVLVGFSMGGAVVLEAAERMPERVLGIVFVDTMKDPESTRSRAEAENMIAQFRTNWGDTAFVRAFAFAPDAPDTLIAQVAQRMPAEPHEHWFEIFHSVGDWLESERIPTLQRTQAPIAAINTTLTPTNVEAMRRYSPSFTVDTIDGVGHAGILLRRVDEFDARLLAIIERFESEGGAN